MTRSNPFNATVLAVCFVLANCTDGERLSSPTTSTAGAPTSTVAAPQSTPTIETQPATTNEDGTTSEPFRVAPAGENPAVLRWDRDTLWTLDDSGRWSEIADGPFVEVAQLPDGEIVFQRVDQEPVIWLLAESGPQELIVADTNQWLNLEGAGLNNKNQPLVFYQRDELGGPPTARTSLRSYNVDTGEVIEIMETGAWEAGSTFNSISGGPVAVANWTTEASSGNTIVDLSLASQQIWDYTDTDCFDGEAGCVFYEAATVTNGRLVGVRPIWNEEEGFVDQFGIFEFDLDASTETLIASFPWDNGLWYVEDMFGVNNQVVLSLTDSPNSSGSPFPALVIDLETGNSTTMTDAGFVRPAHPS